MNGRKDIVHYINRRPRPPVPYDEIEAVLRKAINDNTLNRSSPTRRTVKMGYDNAWNLMRNRPRPPVPYDEIEAVLERKATNGETSSQDEVRKELRNVDGKTLIRASLKIAARDLATLVDTFATCAELIAPLTRSCAYDRLALIRAILDESASSPPVFHALDRIFNVCVRTGILSRDDIGRWWLSADDRSNEYYTVLETYVDEDSLINAWNESDEKSRAALEAPIVRLRCRRGGVDGSINR